MTTKSSPKQYTRTLGRRKAAVATIKVYSGKDENTVNNVPVAKYFPLSSHKIEYDKPFLTTNTVGKYYYQAKILGGGTIGQLESLALAIARALQKIDKSHTASLRAAGLLTVDARVRQRRMVGAGGKSRRQKQSPKR